MTFLRDQEKKVDRERWILLILRFELTKDRKMGKTKQNPKNLRTGRSQKVIRQKTLFLISPSIRLTLKVIYLMIFIIKI